MRINTKTLSAQKKQQRAESSCLPSLSLYLHFPYCLYKCHYCDFNSYAVDSVEDKEEAYVESLIQDWNFYLKLLNPFQINTIFLGGGTPSLFSAQSLSRLLKVIQSSGYLSENVELTLEMNPKTIHPEKILAYQEAGINRFSLGVQSFNDRFLSPLGRIHTGVEARQALQILVDLKVQNFSFDLMYGFPKQSLIDLVEDLNIGLSYQAPHLSYYQLTLEQGTLMYAKHQQQNYLLPSEEEALEMFDTIEKILTQSTYVHYEISNYAKAGFSSKHNLNYWHYQNYLGLGAGAFSFLGADCFKEVISGYGLRWMNPKNPLEYQKQVGQKERFKNALEEISFREAQNEFWMMGLRLSDGVNASRFKQLFGAECYLLYEEKLKKMQKEGLIFLNKDQIYLSPKGKRVANSVLCDLFLDSPPY